MSAARKVREYGARPVLALVEEPKEKPGRIRRRACPVCHAPGALPPVDSVREGSKIPSSVCASCEIQDVLL